MTYIEKFENGSYQLRKKIRNIILNLINNSYFSNKSIGIFIKIIHLTLPFLLPLAMCYGNMLIFLIALIISYIIIIAFVILGGCLLTSLENAIFENNINILNIPMYILGIKINNRNKVVLTWTLFSIWFIFILTICYKRFVNKKF